MTEKKDKETEILLEGFAKLIKIWNMIFEYWENQLISKYIIWLRPPF